MGADVTVRSEFKEKVLVNLATTLACAARQAKSDCGTGLRRRASPGLRGEIRFQVNADGFSAALQKMLSPTGQVLDKIRHRL
jgi:positive regulator of sigma E activity